MAKRELWTELLTKGLQKALKGKRLIFCANTGRCGSKWLAEAMRCVPGIASYWETEPNFAWEVRAAQSDPERIRMWWLDEKLPHVLGHIEPVYFETGHYLTAGALHTLFDMGVHFDLIVLLRDVREVALSFWRRDSIPLRKKDKVWPSDPSVFVPIKYDGLTDYQLVYWWVLEMRARMWDLARKVAERDGKVVATNLYEVVEWGGFERMVGQLGLPKPKGKKFPRYAINPSRPEWYYQLPQGSIDELEAEVLSRLNMEEICQGE
jgi:hypothetical protein